MSSPAKQRVSSIQNPLHRASHNAMTALCQCPVGSPRPLTDPEEGSQSSSESWRFSDRLSPLLRSARSILTGGKVQYRLMMVISVIFMEDEVHQLLNLARPSRTPIPELVLLIIGCFAWLTDPQPLLRVLRKPLCPY